MSFKGRKTQQKKNQPGLVTVMVDTIMTNPSVMNQLKLKNDPVSRKRLSDALKPVGMALCGYEMSRPTEQEVMARQAQFSDSFAQQGMLNPMAMRVYDPIPRAVRTKNLHYEKSIPITRRPLFGVKEFAWTWYEPVGQADFSSEFDNNTNESEVISHPEIAKVHDHDEAYTLSMEELYAALHQGWPIPLAKALTSAKNKKRFVHETLMFGSKKAGRYGLYNHPNIPSDTATGKWSLDSTYMRKDMGFSVGEIRKLTFTECQADTLQMSPSLYQDLLGKDTNGYDPKPMMRFLADNQITYGIENIEVIHELETAASDGGRAVMLYQRTKDCLEAIVDETGQIFPEEITPERMKIKSKGYTADLQYHLPKSARMIEGV